MTVIAAPTSSATVIGARLRQWTGAEAATPRAAIHHCGPCGSSGPRVAAVVAAAIAASARRPENAPARAMGGQAVWPVSNIGPLSGGPARPPNAACARHRQPMAPQVRDRPVAARSARISIMLPRMVAWSDTTGVPSSV